MNGAGPMPLLERAARAAYRELKDDLDIHQMGEEYMWEDHLPLVRAVLAAIREPSEAMLAAGMEMSDSYVPGIPVDLTWKSMIDAALANDHGG